MHVTLSYLLHRARRILAYDRTFVSIHPLSNKVHSVSDIICLFRQFCVCYTFKHLLTEYTGVAVAWPIMAERTFVSRCPLSAKKRSEQKIGVPIAFVSREGSDEHAQEFQPAKTRCLARDLAAHNTLESDVYRCLEQFDINIEPRHAISNNVAY